MLHVAMLLHHLRMRQVFLGRRQHEFMVFGAGVASDKSNLLAALHLDRPRLVGHFAHDDLDGTRRLAGIAGLAGRPGLAVGMIVGEDGCCDHHRGHRSAYCVNFQCDISSDFSRSLSRRPPRWATASAARPASSSVRGESGAPTGSPLPRTSPKIAGITISVSTVDDTIPPIIGTAMRCMISEPAPELHMIGKSPAMIAT